MPKNVQLIANYALHTPLTSFTLKKAGESSVEMKTPANSTFARNFAIVHTSKAADALVDVPVESRENVVYEHCSLVSPSASGERLCRKYTLITFVNGRLVQWPALKRPLNLICQRTLPRHTHPFLQPSSPSHRSRTSSSRCRCPRITSTSTFIRRKRRSLSSTRM